MTVLTPPVDLITTSVLTMLRGAAVKDGPDWVYDAAYSGSPTAPAYPYSILYPLFGGDADPMPDLDDRNDTATLAYQVSSVSNRRNQAQNAFRRARDLMVGRGAAGGYATPLPMPAGWVCVHRAADPAMPGADRTGDNPDAIFTVPARYLLTVAPA